MKIRLWIPIVVIAALYFNSVHSFANTPCSAIVYGLGVKQCLGTILSPIHILTAAHCLVEQNIYTVQPVFDQFRVGPLYEVIKFKLHPNYNVLTLSYDFGVLTLAKPYDFIQATPCKLADKNSPIYVQYKGIRQDPKVVMEADVNIQGAEVCAALNPSIFEPSKMFCTTAEFDYLPLGSGGTLAHKSIVYGIFITGFTKHVQVFASVVPVNEWIREQIKDTTTEY